MNRCFCIVTFGDHEKNLCKWVQSPLKPDKRVIKRLDCSEWPAKCRPFGLRYSDGKDVVLFRVLHGCIPDHHSERGLVDQVSNVVNGV